MQYDKAIDEPVLTREGIVARARSDTAAIGPVVDHGHLGWVRTFAVNQTPLHRLAQGDDSSGLPDEESIDLRQRCIHGVAVKVFQQRSHFRKDVLAQKDERRTCFRGGADRSEADDWRVRQRDDYVRLAD